ncbi:D-glycero-beta-D-manno-heptose 1,7-bisphosphate 7-phosphatase [Ectothiorhodospira lacustris]|uniref:D-glycero-beta-D-manno-heptose 1,7-bisphosphate 7-phosphatase n=1 Tax=Ectothiorhodospira lacustris TaxID=2899127 RepID=UPI001EE8DBA4|nr:D-glycero-beta-D-manno-heptose 1,7-bisphosphate 7-phosphatase [Ectothiorhodospira lacustris]MCG5500700.1 D-glycero-beta-D-manno-heptose 1,7-bisphosphate 7-phosphatase [Ectothiorhodospira lacustris]MCG5509081.1 D-glycero-beta-D-manno-heptose 1,7-bisphosphate 7-phosphatase [Ectothiorhodospira lacustris]MCG5520872.1 D-glycero-beta-D-manno-heptose 1,7-bisphosphate 7-phosphatase [Ectothiorhodospira lacustris]
MKLIILDRDGVINRDSPDYIKSPAEWVPLPGSLEAIARLTRAGWCVAVATNQSGLARGLFDLPTLRAIHQRMEEALAPLGGRIDGIFYCPHGPDEGCDCRKPLPGLFERIGRAFRVSLSGVPAIGDSARDLQAAAAAGCRPILVRTGNGRRALSEGRVPAQTPVFADLAAAVDHLLAETDHVHD